MEKNKCYRRRLKNKQGLVVYGIAKQGLVFRGRALGRRSKETRMFSECCRLRDSRCKDSEAVKSFLHINIWKGARARQACRGNCGLRWAGRGKQDPTALGSIWVGNHYGSGAMPFLCRDDSYLNWKRNFKKAWTVSVSLKGELFKWQILGLSREKQMICK